MDLQSRKIEFIQEFLKLQSEEAISKLEKLLKKERNSAEENEMSPMSIEEFNKRIDQSLKDSKEGRVKSSKDLKSEIDKWA